MTMTMTMTDADTSTPDKELVQVLRVMQHLASHARTIAARIEQSDERAEALDGVFEEIEKTCMDIRRDTFRHAQKRELGNNE